MYQAVDLPSKVLHDKQPDKEAGSLMLDVKVL
jgi:hypothetical protein